MTDRVPDDSWLEPERYELHSGPSYHFDLDRRDFFRVFGSGILILLASEGGLSFQESGARPQRGRNQAPPAELSAWIHIGEDGFVTVYTGKVEVGQNARTSLSQVVAEELRMPVSSVRLVMGDTELTPFDAGTFGSRTTPAMVPQLRKAAASAREVLLELAAERLGSERNSLTIEGGKVRHPGSGRSVGFGELTKGQKLTRTINDTVGLTPVEHWQMAGQSIPKVNGRALVTGKHPI